jgi:hypothetical protein
MLLIDLQDIALRQSSEHDASDAARRWSKQQRLMSLLSAGCVNDEDQLDIEKLRTYSLNQV